MWNRSVGEVAADIRDAARPGAEAADRLAHACPDCNGCVNLETLTCDNCGVALDGTS